MRSEDFYADFNIQMPNVEEEFTLEAEQILLAAQKNTDAGEE